MITKTISQKANSLLWKYNAILREIISQKNLFESIELYQNTLLKLQCSINYLQGLVLRMEKKGLSARDFTNNFNFDGIGQRRVVLKILSVQCEVVAYKKALQGVRDFYDSLIDFNTNSETIPSLSVKNYILDIDFNLLKSQKTILSNITTDYAANYKNTLLAVIDDITKIQEIAVNVFKINQSEVYHSADIDINFSNLSRSIEFILSE